MHVAAAAAAASAVVGSSICSNSTPRHIGMLNFLLFEPGQAVGTKIRLSGRSKNHGSNTGNGNWFFSASEASRPSLEPNKPPTQSIPEVLPRG